MFTKVWFSCSTLLSFLCCSQKSFSHAIAVKSFQFVLAGYKMDEAKIWFLRSAWVHQGSIPRNYLLALMQAQDCGGTCKQPWPIQAETSVSKVQLIAETLHAFTCNSLLRGSNRVVGAKRSALRAHGPPALPLIIACLWFILTFPLLDYFWFREHAPSIWHFQSQNHLPQDPVPSKRFSQKSCLKRVAKKNNPSKCFRYLQSCQSSALQPYLLIQRG